MFGRGRGRSAANRTEFEMSTTTLMVLAGVGIFLAWRAWTMRPVQERIAAARSAIEAGARLVDVRTPAEFAGGHPAGAINVPLAGLQGNLAAFGPKEGDVVIGCATGARSRAAAALLRQAGYRNVIDVGSLRNL